MRNVRDRLKNLSKDQQKIIMDYFKQRRRQDSKLPMLDRDYDQFKLSPIQQRLWTLNQMVGQNPFYNVPSVFRLTGTLNIEAFETSLIQMMDRYEILRTSFTINDVGDPVQLISTKLDSPLVINDLTVYSNVADNVIEHLILDEIKQPFCLETPPLWRALLLRVDEEDYYLVLTMHHTIFDGWSLSVFMQELTTIYESISKGVTPELPDVNQYTDFVQWHQSQVTEEMIDQQLNYWKKKLADQEPILDLPIDGIRSPDDSFEGKSHFMYLPKKLYDALKELSKQEGVTLYGTLLTAFSVLLYRYTNQHDISIGTPTSGRYNQALEEMIGPFINTLVLRNDLSNNPSFNTLLKQVHQSNLKAFENQDAPFDLLVETIQPKRHLGYSPMFQVMFTLQNALPDIELEELTLEYKVVDSGTAKYDLSLDIFESPKGPLCIFEYNTSLFEEDRIKRLSQHFKRLLEKIVEQPTERIDHISYVSDMEYNELIYQWNQTDKNYDLDQMVHQIIEQQANQHPHKVAVVCEGQKLTYHELNSQANRLARHLQTMGVERNVKVAICLEKSTHLIVTTLAVLKAGGAFLPIDPDHPINRINFMMKDMNVPLLITTTSLRNHVKDSHVQVLLLDQEEKISSYDDTNIHASIKPSDLAYVIYTSGSTGKPKGTIISHANWSNAYWAYNDAYDLQSSCHSHLQMASISFDVYAGDFIRALCSGAKLVLCPKDIILDGEKLYQLMVGENVDCAEFVPTVFRNLAHFMDETGQTLDWMQVLVISSDIWYVHEFKKYKKYCGPGTRLINAYGVTEATIDSTYFEGSVNSFSGDELPPIGYPLGNNKIYILDQNLQPVPIGVPGELYIGGLSVSQGYHKRPELNEKHFIPDPFNTYQATMYRTGDIGSRLADGNIKLMGREDHQVKIRGLRIELGEIEWAISRNSNIRECAVVVHDDDRRDKLIVAYIVTNSESSFDVELLRDELRDILPDYMVPNLFVSLPSMPLTASGKIDRRSLPEPENMITADDGTYVGPRTSIEEVLSEIWKDAFGINRVGIYEDFFNLGGHSLLAIQMMVKIRETFAVDLPMKILFEHSQIASLAEVIAKNQGKETEYRESINIPTVTPDVVNKYEPFPLTDVQQAYWIGRSGDFELGNISTHNYDEMSLPPVDVDRFKHVWMSMIMRHDMLRAIVHPDGLQEILEEIPKYELPVIDLRGKDPLVVEEIINGIRDEMSHQILKTDQWPLFDVRLSLLDDEARLHVSTDSLTFDAWSFVVLIKELITAYENPDLQLPELEFSFRDYVLAEQELMESELYERSWNYWQDRLDELPPAPEIPLVKDPSQIDKPRFNRLHDQLDDKTWRRLQAKATSRGMTATGILLAAYAEVLSNWSKNPHFTLNLTFLNRHSFHPQVNDIVGEFTSLTLLEVDHRKNDSFEQRAVQTQERLWSDLEHHHVSGIRVLRELKRRDGGLKSAKMPIVFTSALTLPIPKESPVSLEPVHSITQTSQVMLDCGVWEEDGILYCNWDVVDELFPDGMIEDMFTAYMTLIRQLANEEDVWKKPFISLVPEEHLQLQEVVNHTEEDFDYELLHSAFDRQVDERPNQQAIITTQRTLSYEEISRYSNQVARFLKDKGARKNTLIGIFMEKGWEQIIASLAIVKSGAAFLPIDPKLPENRVLYLIENGMLDYILTQSKLDDLIEWPPHVKRLFVDLEDKWAAYDDQPVTSPAEPDDLAYVMFTSGSTGDPKGVMIDHQSALNTLYDINKRFDVQPADKVFAISAFNFDLSIFDIFGVLGVGGTIVMPDDDLVRDPAHWLYMLNKYQVTIWNSVPAFMNMIIEYIQGQDVNISIPSSLRLVMMSGDWIPLKLPDQIRELWPIIDIYSLGGATEASIWSIYYPIEKVDENWKSIPYGKPMFNQQFYILNEFMEPCPLWVTGELYIAGKGLAKGYWRDRDRTDQQFITHPHRGERLYRTGDLGRYLLDGNIEFLGREDTQVKIQGYRIELGEIEAGFDQHQEIDRTVITAIGDDDALHSLVAYYTVRNNHTIEQEELSAFLKRIIPEYMVPSYFIQMDTFPLTANGKIDRKRLPVVTPKDHGRGDHYVPPRNSFEEQMAFIWGDILGLESVGIHDNFFHIGGDSMQTVRLVNRMRSELNIDIPIRQLFETPYIIDLADMYGKQIADN